ncbi:MAG: SEL1-like repeat protein [Phycisphaerae bacterium]|nr:SEL1-like repeat protein [Phycisphaerae bacterium]
MPGKSKSVFIIAFFVTCLCIWGCTSEEEVQKPVINDSAITLIKPSENLIAPGISQTQLKEIVMVEITADSGNPDACYYIFRLASMYIAGVDIPVNKVQAGLWLQKAIDKGDSGSAVLLDILNKCETDNMAQCFTKNLQDYLQSKAAPDPGDARAMMYLAECYTMGLGTSKNEELYVSWTIKAAQSGDVYAMRCLGYNYFNGIELKTDNNPAIVWLEKAAKQGDIFAMDALGIIFAEGGTNSDDQARSIYWYEQKIDQLTMLADKGDANAMYKLGQSYLLGRCVDKDLAISDQWFKKAADIYLPMAQKDNLGAMLCMSCMYNNGWGVNVDKVQGRFWTDKVAQLTKVASFKDYTDLLLKEMTPDQLQQGQ